MPRIQVFIILILLSLHLLVLVAGAEEQSSDYSNVGFGLSYIKDTIPDRLEPGRSYPVLVTFKNSGLVSWDRKNHRIGMAYGGNLTEVVALPSFVEISEKAPVYPGKEVSFALTLLPVALPGDYTISFYVAFQTAQGEKRVTEVWSKKIIIVPTDGVSSPLNGSISVDSVYPGLSISLNGQTMGTTPCIIPDLKPGSYDLIISGIVSRTIPVHVEKSTLSRVFIGNVTAEPVIDLKKINIVSNGTLFEYLEANIPLVGIVSLLIVGCIVLMVRGVRLRRKQESEDKENLKIMGTKRQLDGASSLEEKDLLDKYHSHPSLLEQASPGSDPGSGSDAGPKVIDVAVGGMKNVRKFSRDMLDKNRPDHEKGQLGGLGSLASKEDTALQPVAISLDRLEVRPRSAVAHFSALNQSKESLSVEGISLGPGMSAPVPVEVTEPDTDEYEMTVSLKVLSQKGQEFFRHMQIPYNRGVALLARGMMEKAYEYFHQYVRKQPGHIDALIRQAGVLLTWGLEEEAESLLNEVLAVDPNQAEALEILKQIAALKEKRIQEKKKEVERPKIPGFPDSLNDRYTPIRLLGKDAFASIVLALRNDTGELRALKIAHEGADVGSSLFTEISVLYQLKHPNVLKMFRAEFTPALFLELEYVSGIQCSDRLCRTLGDLEHPVPEEAMVVFIEKIALGLAYLHQKGVRHYHLSPRHILLDEPMTPKISGIIQESVSRSGSETVSPALCLAPEQINREKFGKLGKRTDVFQLGAIWYWLMTGKTPYPDGSVSNNGEGGFVSGVYLSPGLTHPGYSKYDPLLKNMLALDKHDRYSSVDEFIAELKGLGLQGESADLRDES